MHQFFYYLAEDFDVMLLVVAGLLVLLATSFVIEDGISWLRRRLGRQEQS